MCIQTKVDKIAKVKIALCGMGSFGMANGKRLLNLGNAEIAAIAVPQEDRQPGEISVGSRPRLNAGKILKDKSV